MVKESGPLRLAILTSHDATGIEELIASPNRGVVFNIAVVISSDTTFAQLPAVDGAGIPTVFKPLKEFADVHGSSLRNLREREGYDAETIDLLGSMDIDYVVLLGYRYLLTEPFIAEYADKIIALHDGDLTARDDDGHRRYIGLHAVREAILNGERQTRSSAYFVTREAGNGPLFLLSPPCAVTPLVRDAKTWGDFDLLSAYAELHRRWMVRATWGPMLLRGLEFLAAGRLQVIRDLVWIDGVPGPCRMGEAPGLCRDHVDTLDAGVPGSCPLIRGV